MGLIYSVEISDNSKTIGVDITLSSRACPMGAAILGGSENILQAYFPGYVIDVRLVWDPGWSPEFISGQGRKFLEE